MEIRPTYLIMVTSQNNNKYYNCFPDGDSFRVEYGRVNSTKTVTTYPISKWDHQISSKIKKGYKDVTDLKQDLIEEVKEENPDSPYDEIENESVRRIVEKLQNLAKEKIRKNYTVTESAVTQDMVDEAQKVIDNLSNNKFSVEDFNNELLKLFTIIPRKMQDVRSYLAKDDSDFSKIVSEEQDLLDVMRGQIYVKPDNVVENSHVDKKGHTILDELGLEMDTVTNEEIEKIKDLMAESKHKFRNAWKVTNKKTQKRFDDFVKNNNITNTKLLFHGSRSENWFSIIKTGLVLRPTNAVITGKMFGFGIYYAPKCQKSIGYTSLSGSYWAHGGNHTAYMALFEVAYGTPYDVYNFDSKYYDMTYEKLQKIKPGSNCLHAHSDRGMLRNDEIVVYKEEQMTIKYLIEIGD